MKRSVVLVLLASFLAQPVLAQSLASQRVLKEVSQLYSADSDEKQAIDEAQDEASDFTFSDGVDRGENLSRAFAMIRSKKPMMLASDMDLAIAILQVQ